MMQRITKFLMGPLVREHTADHDVLRRDIEALYARQFESAALVETLKARLELEEAQQENRDAANR